MEMEMEMEIKIPKISDDKLDELRKRIKPVKEKNGELFYFKDCDPRNQSFSWGELVDKAEGLKAFASLPTLHSYGYYGFFKPSVAEVLSQLPEYVLDKTVAFKTIGPETASDVNKHKKEFDAGFHVAETILYTKEQ